jgi:nucleoside-diphosphate-sugar epimerase
MDANPVSRGNAYAYGKVKQDELVLDYARRFDLNVAIVRPGSVFGPGRANITGRVGIDTFGVYLHLGGANLVPFTFVDNCAEAMVLACVKKGADGQIFNVVDDELPSSRAFLRSYKKHAKQFTSVYVPYRIFYLFCLLWEKYSVWSKGQFPPVFNRARAQVEWKGNTFSNQKLKDILGWTPRVSMAEGLMTYLAYVRDVERWGGNA